MNVVDCMGDEEAFGPWFHGPSWDAWKVTLKAAFAIRMTPQELITFGELAGGRKPPAKRVRELWIIAGRRAGKDSIASMLAAYFASIEQGHIGRLRPGEKASILCLSCDRDQSGIVMGYAASYFDGVPDLKSMVTRETRLGFELSNGAEIVIATNSFRQTRGKTVLLAIFDEVAYWRDERSASPDLETYRALVPSMATLPDAMLIGISSPYRRAGLLFEKWKTHFGEDDDRVLVIQAPSLALNPTLDPEEIAADVAKDPAAARAEWFAEFRDDIGVFVPIELIEAAVDRGVLVRPARPGVHYVAFVDVASGTGQDSFALGIAHKDGNDVILDCAHEIRPPFNPQAAAGEIAALIKGYGVHQAQGDRYGAGFSVEAFASHGVTLNYSERDRSQIYVECIPLFSAGRARLVDNKKLVTQFASLERRTSVTGRDSIDHPRGSHDDLCNAAAGALVAAATGPGPMVITDELLNKFRMAGPWRPPAFDYERSW